MKVLESFHLDQRDPEAILQDLIETGAPISETNVSSITSVCLEILRGYFQLSYKGKIPGRSSYDWIGLFPSESAPDNAYVAWQWACRGRAYHSPVNGNTQGFEVRYFTYTNGEYTCIGRSGPLNPKCGLNKK